MLSNFDITKNRTIQNGVIGYKVFQTNYLLIVEKPKREYEFFVQNMIGDNKPLTPRLYLHKRTLKNLTNDRTTDFKTIYKIFDNEIEKEDLISFLNEVIIDLENLSSEVFEKKDIKTEKDILLTKEIKEKAEGLLRSPDLLRQIRIILDSEVVGEEKNKLISFLLALSGQTKYPQILIFKGSSTGGKSKLANCVTDPFFDKVWKVGRLSKTALDYKEDLDEFNILYLQEMSEEESKGHIRLISNRDGGYRIAITIKEGGELQVFEKNISPKTLIVTSTVYEFEEQFETRAFIISVDESEEQSKKILKHKISKHKEEIIEYIGIEEEYIGFKVLNAAVRLLKPCKICIPYLDALENVFETTSLRIRADFDKFVDLIKLCSYLHQYQRPSIDLKNGKNLIFATFQDLEYIRLLADDILLSTISGLDKRVKEVYEVICKLRDEILEENEVMREKTEEKKQHFTPKTLDFTVKEITTEMYPLSQDRVYKILETLVKRGKLLKTKKEGHGNKNFYSLRLGEEAFGILEMRIPEYPTLEECVRNNLEYYSLSDSLNTYYMCIVDRVANSPLSKETNDKGKDGLSNIRSDKNLNSLEPSKETEESPESNGLKRFLNPEKGEGN